MSASKEVQVMHIGPLTDTPSPSSFVIKLMTYLRMAKIDYKEVHTTKSSSEGKMPFIVYNGVEMADSSFIIEFLNKEFNVDLNSRLSDCDKAISLAFQRLSEENLYWTVVYHRWFDGKKNFLAKFPFSGIMRAGFKVVAAVKLRPAFKANLQGHGMGRHSPEQIYRIAEKDITALSTFLGEKPFFMGENPTEVDAAIFGLMSQFAFAPVGTKEETLIKDEFPNITAYCERMRAKYWPDWDQLCAHKK